MEIEGKDIADELAKEATKLEPLVQTTALACCYRQIRKDLHDAWITE
jgi:hypothetical protein